jgi:hypothetical protein
MNQALRNIGNQLIPKEDNKKKMIKILKINRE